MPEGAYVLAEPIEEHIIGLHKRYPAKVTADVRYRSGGKAYQRSKSGPLVEPGTGEPIVAAQAAMLAVHWAMTSEAPVSRRVRGL